MIVLSIILTAMLTVGLAASIAAIGLLMRDMLR